MGTLVKFNTFTRELLKGTHDFTAHTFKLMLTNAAPSAADALKADETDIGAGSGYSAGGKAIAATLSLSGGVAKIVFADTSFVAAGGSIGPFRYAVIYNDTAASDPLIAYADAGSSVTIPDGDTYLWDFDASAGAFTVG